MKTPRKRGSGLRNGNKSMFGKKRRRSFSFSCTASGRDRNRLSRTVSNIVRILFLHFRRSVVTFPFF